MADILKLPGLVNLIIKNETATFMFVSYTGTALPGQCPKASMPIHVLIQKAIFQNAQ